ncbi:MAG: hypothetical protein GX801_03595 [Fibrobacter sp.]|nr:hypothetical protein [Fibrobacter sp.]
MFCIGIASSWGDTVNTNAAGTVSHLIIDDSAQASDDTVQVSGDSILAQQAINHAIENSSTAPIIKNLVKDSRTAILYLDGSLASPWYYLGILKAVEQYQIPLEKIVASGIASWVVALWNQGYSLDSLERILIDANYPVFELGTARLNNNANLSIGEYLAPKGFPSFKQQYAVDFSSKTQERFFPIPNQVAFEDFSTHLKLQTPLMAPPKPYKISWHTLLCQEQSAQLTLSPEAPNWQWINASFDPRGERIGKQLYLPAQNCALQSLDYLQNMVGNKHFVIYATPWPMRKDGLNLKASQRFELQHLGKSIEYQVLVNPHWLKADSLEERDYWQQLALKDMRSRLGQIKKYQLKPYQWGENNKASIVSSLRIDSPALDEISAEYQNHIQSYWPSDYTDWVEALDSFSLNLQKSQLYGDISLNLQEQSQSELGYGGGLDSNFLVLNLQAKPRSIVAWQLGGMGTTYSGPAVLGKLSLRAVNQFEYFGGLKLKAGTFAQGLEPFLTISKLSQQELSFSISMSIQRQNFNSLWKNLSFSQAKSGIEEISKIRALEKRSISFRVNINPKLHQYLSPYIYLSDDYFNTELITRTNKILWVKNPVKNIKVTAINAGLDFVWGRDTSGDYFASNAKNLHANLAVKSEAPHLLGSKPTHLNYGGEVLLKFAHLLTPNWSVGLQGSFGLQGRVPEGLIWLYPDSIDIVPQKLTDPAISNYYRLAMPITPLIHKMPLPQFRSHHYGTATAHAAWIWGPLSLWLHATFINDFEGPDIYNELQDRRSAMESTLRFKWKSLEARAGAHFHSNLDDFTKNISETDNWLFFAQIGFLEF